MMEAGGYRAAGASLSGIGGVDSGADAAEFILLGSDTVQVGGARTWRGLQGCIASLAEEWLGVAVAAHATPRHRCCLAAAQFA